MDNLIDRQAALDAIMGQPPEPHYPSWYAAQIEKLPAAQPDHNADISKKVEQTAESAQNAQNGDLIQRKAAIDAIRVFYADECALVDSIEEQLEKLPAAQPEIIRCKDCDWWTKQKDSLQGRCELMQMYPTGGWYCGNARRRGGDSD